MRTLLHLIGGSAVLLSSPFAALGTCPSWLPDGIFCDRADTYCWESSGGHPGDSRCPSSGATRRDQALSEVWLREPRAGCGTEPIVEEEQARLVSPPYGIRYPCQGNAQLGSATIRDWVHSPYPLGEDGQIRNLSWLIENKFGAQNTAVIGTDDQPLILEYMVDGQGAGQIHWGNGYLEVSLDDANESTRIDRANTDYADSPDCNTYCNPYIQIEPMPIICAQGNPDTSAVPMPAACPDIATNPPPIRHSIATGVLSLVDLDPCHCGSTTAHGPYNTHLTVYDGQKWWTLRPGSPSGPGITMSGSIAPRGDSPMPPPPDSGLSTPGSFTLNGGNGGFRMPNKGFNWVRLVIRSSTIEVALTTQETSTIKIPNSQQYYQYYVTSEIKGLPRAYLGAFNALRLGVGQGCRIQGTPNNPWACGGSNTHCLRSRANSAGSLAFDDIFFRGGAPIVEEGACCHPDGTCSDLLQSDCDGIFRGRSTFCATLGTPCCPQIYGDTDADGDVDMDDFGVFQTCLDTDPLSNACRCLDGDGNGQINALDFNRFVQCTQGPDVPGLSGAPCSGAGW